jgi:hypothetical protein
MALAVASNVGNKVNQMGNFKELYVGAGSTIILKGNKEGCFSGAVNYSTAPLKWNNAGIFRCTGAFINGEITATGGSITGDLTVTGSLLSSDSSAFQTKLLNGKVSFLKSGVEKAFISTSAGSNGLRLASVGSVYFVDIAGMPNAEIDNSSNLKFSNDAYISWASGRKITAGSASITIDGGLIVTNTGNTAKVASNGFNIYGGSDGDNGTGDFISAVRSDSGKLQYKKRSLTFTNGIITDFGDETDWETFHTF